MWTQFLRDEGGFIISAELVLVATICVCLLYTSDAADE